MKKILLICFLLIGLLGCGGVGEDNNICETELIVKDGISYYKGTPFNGMAEISFTFNGVEIREETNYKNGMKNGEYIKYENRIIKEKKSYKENELNGSSFIYDNNGKIISEKNYKNNKQDGFDISYNDEGIINFKYNYKDGALDGECISYNFDGSFRIICNYKNGKLDGKVTHYYWNNQIKLIEIWNNDDLYKETSYYLNGRIEGEGYYKDGERTGEWIWYNQDGSINFKKKY